MIKNGSFKMGSPPSALGRPVEEGAVRQVDIVQTYAIGLYEVTQGNWDACFLAGGCDKIIHEDPKGDNYPVVNVSWRQASQYVAWVSGHVNTSAMRCPSSVCTCFCGAVSVVPVPFQTLR